MLRAVLFDIDDTLYSTTDFAEQARRNAVAAMVRMGLDVDPEDALRELKEVISEFSSNYDRHYDKLLRRFPREALGELNPALIVAAGVVAYHETKSRQLLPYRHVERTLKVLSERTDLTLGVLTAGLEVKQAEKLIRLGLHSYFDPRAIFISDQVGISKPNPKLWLYAAEKLGLAPREIMYVGDSPAHDIAPAKAVGMVAVRYRGTGKHAGTQSPAPPDHEIGDFDQLLKLLREEYGLPV